MQLNEQTLQQYKLLFILQSGMVNLGALMFVADTVVLLLAILRVFYSDMLHFSFLITDLLSC
jgi:hypothetical protein